tara:strand:- start:78 stop:263 length:186 start_codon:yes stop_codon:yes gene_type:complete
MMPEYTDEKIEKAVDNLIDSWDMGTIIEMVYEDRLHYFLHHADQEEISELIQDFTDGDENG